MPCAIRIAVIDDHPMFREGAMQIFAGLDDMEVVAEGATAADALRLAKQFHPDVMLLDISLPGGGLEAAAGIARACPNVRTVMLTASESELDVAAALQAGARGYILKGSSGAEVVETVRAIFRGESYIAPYLAAKLLLTLDRAATNKREGAPTRKRGARTTIGKAFLRNHLEIELCAHLFLLSIDEKL